MLTVAFEGWWQCRFATDPDPSDDPRGVSGPTFTVAGEPAFDRVVRLQDPVTPRYPHEHDIGVAVTAVSVDGEPEKDHPLLGGRVELLGDAEFRQRNLIYVDAPFVVLIDPFDLQISGGGITLRRAALWDVTRPSLRIDDVFDQPALITPRTNTIEVRSPIVAEATGVMDYTVTRTRRLADLRALLAEAPDDISRAALRKRVAALEADRHLDGARLAAEQFMGMRAGYAFALDGDPKVIDHDGGLRGDVGRSQVWQVDFWLGGYDVDTLCGYMSGTLSVPFRRSLTERR